MTTRHARRKPRTGTLPLLGISLLSAALLGGLIVTDPANAAFTDKAAARVVTTSSTLKTPVVGTARSSGTGQIIQTQVAVSCTSPATPQWRWRDHMVEWGPDSWNPWSAWSSTMSGGSTAWSTSTMMLANRPAEVQWNLRCVHGNWLSNAVLTKPLTIVRTT